VSDTLSSAKTVLEADATLLLLATGGVWDYDETGRMGIGRTNTAAAFDATSKIIKPCLLVKLRSTVAFGDIGDDPSRISGARDMLEVWAYQDSGYSTIKSMLARVYTLLQGKQLGGFVCRWAMDVQPLRDIDLDANVQRSDYEVFWLRS
jgi:hypothetical protein